MKAKIKFWAGYFGKWDILPTVDIFGKEVDIDEKLVDEYNETIEKLRKLTKEIWDVYNGNS